MSSALVSVQRPRTEVGGSAAGAPVLSTSKSVRGRGFLERDGLCSLPGQVSEDVERVGAFVPVRGSPAPVLSALLSEQWLTSAANSRTNRMCATGVRVSDGEVRVVFMKQGLTSRGSYPGFSDYDRALNVLRAWRTERFVLHEQRV